MALHYLSGDDIGKGKKKQSSGSGGARKPSKAAKRAAKKKAPKQKKTKEQKKAARKRVLKKVAKVAVAPARAAMLTAMRLNLLKLSTKIVRVWNKGGKEDIVKWWEAFGGKKEALTKAVSQGAKDNISGDKMGSATVAATIASATPLIVALVPIIKKFKAAGDEKEAAEFNQGVDDAKRELANDDSVPKSEVSMPKNKDAGIVVDKSGESQTDEKVKEPESKSGGTDSDDEGGEKKNGMTAGRSSGGSSSEESASEESKSSAAKKELASNYSPLGFFFMIIMYIMQFKLEGTIVSLISLYCLIGMILIPFASKFKFANVISYGPINLINGFIQQTKIIWQKS